MAETPQLRDRSRAARRRGPVFVDSSGRSLGRVRVIGWAALTAVVGYVALLVVAVLGGPNVVAPNLLRPTQAPQAAPAPTGQPAQAPAPSGPAPAPVDQAVAAAVAVPAPAQAPAPGPAPVAAAPAPSAAAPAPAPPAAEAASATDAEPGKSESAPGQTSRPTAPAKP